MAGSFALDLQKFAEKAAEKADLAVANVVSRIAFEIDGRSPVGDASYWQHPAPKGYVGGRFRGSWQLGVDSAASGRDVIDPSGASALNAINAAIPDEASGRVYYLTNSLPYARRIEDGWSRRAPQGLVALTAMTFQQKVDEAVAAVKS